MEPAAIQPEMSVAEVCRRWPAAAAVLVRRGMACVGCDLSDFETLADAARTYHVPLAALLHELRAAAAPPAPPTSP
jgi:hybrid cluster-associated redox disulfide protein